jgi:hypothetical protein
MLRIDRCSLHPPSVAKLVVALLVTAIGTLSFSVRQIEAADTLAYSFESGTDGFGPNGGGISVTQDTVGATDGTQALRIAVVGGATFAGALTANIDPLVLGDPPGVDHVTFDLTVNSPFPTPPITEGFAVIGVTIFGASQPGPNQLTGLSVQFFDQIDPAFNNEKHLDGMEPGLYKDFRIDLTHATHPLTFDERQSFNEIFGEIGSGENDIIPSGFQFYINKTGGEAFPVNISIDNVRFGVSVAGDYNGNGIVDAADYTVWRNTLGSTTDLTANGDDTGESMGKIDQADYVFWKSRFGAVSGAGSVGSVGVPEPANAILLVLAGLGCCGARIVRVTRAKTAG